VIFRPLEMAGAWEVSPVVHEDARGAFVETFRLDEVADVIGRDFRIAQVNTSLSRAGVVRGVHFADVPPSQAKYVTCTSGAIFDVVVDVRVGSPTFGKWDSVVLDDINRRALLITEGLGHALMSLDDDSTVTYLCNAPYAPGREHGVHPLDTELAIAWPRFGRDGQALTPTLSDKDADAPRMNDAIALGLLPEFALVCEYLTGVDTR